MSSLYIVFGSWKLRHNEPLQAGEGGLRLHAAPGPDALHSLLIDVRGPSKPAATVVDGALAWCDDSAPERACANLAIEELPLAAVRFDNGVFQITHLLTRVESHITHLIRPHHAVAPAPGAQLETALRAAFEANHIFVNNFECYYIKGMPDTELEQKFHIRGQFDYHEVNRALYAKFGDGKVPGFALQLGDELEHWAYDNDFARILPNVENAAGYLSIMHWSRKRKTEWDEPVVTFKKKLYAEDALERWERNYGDQTIATTPEAALAEFFELPIEMLPSWRRTRYDIACEVLATGNIFMVNFEDSRVRDDRTSRGRLQQCEIEYLKTRGEPDEATIYRDFALLTEKVEQFMDEHGIGYERTNYSKLTFLDEYVKAGRALAGEAA
ncbi:MAG: hypothetical protein V4754_22045 [Pseudomonadota bacterium]